MCAGSANWIRNPLCIKSLLSRSFVCNRAGAVTVIIFVMYVYIHTCRFLSFILDSCSQKLHFARTPAGSCVTQCLRQFAASESLSLLMAKLLSRRRRVSAVLPQLADIRLRQRRGSIGFRLFLAVATSYAIDQTERQGSATYSARTHCCQAGKSAQ